MFNFIKPRSSALIYSHEMTAPDAMAVNRSLHFFSVHIKGKYINLLFIYHISPFLLT